MTGVSEKRGGWRKIGSLFFGLVEETNRRLKDIEKIAASAIRQPTSFNLDSLS
jgi:hypothetical protein